MPSFTIIPSTCYPDTFDNPGGANGALGLLGTGMDWTSGLTTANFTASSGTITGFLFVSDELIYLFFTLPTGTAGTSTTITITDASGGPGNGVTATTTVDYATLAIISPASVGASSTGNTIDLSSVFAYWPSGTSAFVSVDVGTITASNVSSGQSGNGRTGTITYTAPASGSVATFTDLYTGATATLSITGGSSGTVATPTFSPAAGTYSSAQSVTIATTTGGSSIRYTTDGTDPTDSTGTVYTGAVSVSATETLKAIAYQAGWTDSALASAAYTISGGGTVATPSIAPSTGTYIGTQTVTLSDGTSGASIYYSLDDTDPTSASTLYSAPFAVSSTATVKAIGIKAGDTNSAITSSTITITSVSYPSAAKPTTPILSRTSLPNLVWGIAATDALSLDPDLVSGQPPYTGTGASGGGCGSLPVHDASTAGLPLSGGGRRPCLRSHRSAAHLYWPGTGWGGASYSAENNPGFPITFAAAVCPMIATGASQGRVPSSCFLCGPGTGAYPGDIAPIFAANTNGTISVGLWIGSQAYMVSAWTLTPGHWVALRWTLTGSGSTGSGNLVVAGIDYTAATTLAETTIAGIPTTELALTANAMQLGNHTTDADDYCSFDGEVDALLIDGGDWSSSGASALTWSAFQTDPTFGFHGTYAPASGTLSAPLAGTACTPAGVALHCSAPTTTTGGATSISYQWQYSNGDPSFASPVTLSGATSPSYLHTAAPVWPTGTGLVPFYRCQVSDGTNTAYSPFLAGVALNGEANLLPIRNSVGAAPGVTAAVGAAALARGYWVNWVNTAVGGSDLSTDWQTSSGSNSATVVLLAEAARLQAVRPGVPTYLYFELYINDGSINPATWWTEAQALFTYIVGQGVSLAGIFLAYESMLWVVPTEVVGGSGMSLGNTLADYTAEAAIRALIDTSVDPDATPPLLLGGSRTLLASIVSPENWSGASNQDGCHPYSSNASPIVMGIDMVETLTDHLSGAGGSGTFPTAAQVLSGVAFGPTNNLTGTVTLPTADEVASGVTFGAAGGTTGTAPAPADVAAAVWAYGNRTTTS